MSVLGTGAVCLGIVLVSLTAVHPSAEAALRFIGYIMAFNLLPGLIATRLLLPRIDCLGSFLSFSLALGVLVNLIVLIPLWAFGQMAFMTALPFAAAAGLMAGFRRLALLDLLSGWRVGRSEAIWLAGTCFVCATALLSMAHILSGDPDYGFSFHFAFQGVIVRGLEHGWPPSNLLLPDVPLSYNYAAHLWVLGAGRATGLPIDVLVARYAPVFLGGSAAALMMGFGRRVLGLPWWIAGLAVTCPFWIVGVPPVAAGIFGTFMPFGSTLLLSPFLAFLVFFVTIAFVTEGWPGHGVWRGVILVALMFLATGARGVCPPILLSALALRWLIAWRSDRAYLWQTSADLLAALAGFAAGLWFFFTLGSGFSGTGFIHFTGQPFDFLADPGQYLLVVPHVLMDFGFSKVAAGAVAFILIAVFQAGFLAPALLTAMQRRVDPPAILLLASAAAGIAAVFVTEAPGYSHFSFLYFANVSLSLLGAKGLNVLVAGRFWQGRGRPAGLTCLGLIVLLAGLQFAQLPWPTLAWLGHNMPAATTALLTQRSRIPLPIAACQRNPDADLFRQAAPFAPDPVVIMLPKQASGAFYCEAFWLVVHMPLQTVSSYALTFIPGAASPPLNQILASRLQHMNAAIALASRGILSVSDLSAIASTLDHRRTVLVLADRSLSPDRVTGVEKVGSNDRLALWHILSPGA